MTNVLLDGFSNYWHRRKSSMKTTPGKKPPALRGCLQLRSVPSLWSGMPEQARSIRRGLKVNKNSAEGEVFLVDFPSYRALQAAEEPGLKIGRDFSPGIMLAVSTWALAPGTSSLPLPARKPTFSAPTLARAFVRPAIDNFLVPQGLDIY
jgi:hypothetical protein